MLLDLFGEVSSLGGPADEIQCPVGGPSANKVAVAVELVAQGFGLSVLSGQPKPDGSDGLLFGASTGAGDARDGDGEVASANPQSAFCHRPGTLFTDRTVGAENFGGDPENFGLRGVGVGHRIEEEIIGTSGNAGQHGTDHAAGAGFRGRKGQPARPKHIANGAGKAVVAFAVNGLAQALPGLGGGGLGKRFGLEHRGPLGEQLHFDFGSLHPVSDSHPGEDGFKVAEPLLDRGFGQAVGSKVGLVAIADAVRRDGGNDALLEDVGHLPRHPRGEETPGVSDAQFEPRGGSDGVHQNVRADGHIRLFGAGIGEGAASTLVAPPEDFEGRWIPMERNAGRLRRRRRGEIVGGWPQAASADNDSRDACELLQGRGDLLWIVRDGSMFDDIKPQQDELFAEPGGVGIDELPAGELGPDRKKGCRHKGRTTLAKARSKVKTRVSERPAGTFRRR